MLRGSVFLAGALVNFFFLLCAAPVISLPPANTVAVLGGSVTFLCEAMGVHPLNISWNSTGGEIMAQSGLVNISVSQTASTTSRSELSILVATTGDETGYTCTAVNVDGSVVSSEASLTLQGE